MIPWVANAALLLGLLCLAKKKREGFLFNIVGNSLWGWIACVAGAQELFIINLVFVVVSAYSWVNYDPED